MGNCREVFGNILMWLFIILVVIFGYYLGGYVNFSGLVIISLVLIIIGLIGNSMERGQGNALLSLALIGWFLMGFIPGLVISNWSKWFT